MKGNSFRHQNIQFQTIRIAYLTSRDDKPSLRFIDRETKELREKYSVYLRTNWDHFSPYCFLKSEIETVCYFNPADLARWGGQFPPTTINSYQEARMLPVSLIFTGAIDEVVDAKLRERLAGPDDLQVEVFSWFVYNSFRACMGTLRKSDFAQTALVFLQKSNTSRLTDERSFFSDLKEISLTRGRWRPLVVGLLKGNIDGFILYGKIGSTEEEADRTSNIEELASCLASKSLRERLGGTQFWSEASPILAYFGYTLDGYVIDSNFALLERSFLRQLTPISATSKRRPSKRSPAASNGATKR